MKIALITHSIIGRTHYGRSARVLANGLKARGYDVEVLAQRYATSEEEIDNAKINEQEIVDGITEHHFLFHKPYEMDAKLQQIKPDAVLVFAAPHEIYAFLTATYCPSRVPVGICFPWAFLSAPFRFWDMMMRFPTQQNLIATNEFSEKLLMSNGSITPCIGGDWRSRAEKVINMDRKELRKKWSKIWQYEFQDDEVVFLCTDNNLKRKRLDLMLYFIQRVRQEGINAKLALHTNTGLGEFDVKSLSVLYGVSEDVVIFDNEKTFPLFSQDQMAEMYRIADYKLSFSGAQAHCYSALESMGVGLINIVPRTTAYADLMGKVANCVVVAGVEDNGDRLQDCPNVVGAVGKFLEIHNSRQLQKQLLEGQYALFNQATDEEDFVSRWEVFLNNLKKPNYDEHHEGYTVTGLSDTNGVLSHIRKETNTEKLAVINRDLYMPHKEDVLVAIDIWDLVNETVFKELMKSFKQVPYVATRFDWPYVDPPLIPADQLYQRMMLNHFVPEPLFAADLMDKDPNIERSIILWRNLNVSKD